MVLRLRAHTAATFMFGPVGRLLFTPCQAAPALFSAQAKVRVMSKLTLDPPRATPGLPVLP